MKPRTWMIWLPILLVVLGVQMAVAHDKSDGWRTDVRRPDGHAWEGHQGTFGWHVDPRRPSAWFGEAMVSAPPAAPKPAPKRPAGDQDGDGVSDDNDRCPGTPQGAQVDSWGCPQDSDGDGVYNGLDRCPDTPRGAQVDSRGCPSDADGDGVYDGLDRCPDTQLGVVVDANGCPKPTSKKEEELLDTGTLRLEDVLFETNSATLKSESFPVLDEVGEILAKWPQLHVEIGGHTDSRGTDVYNMGLSERRAQSVLNYLVRRIPSLRKAQLNARGYGETQPVATNDTAEGMTKNRRVEFKVLNREVLRKVR